MFKLLLTLGVALTITGCAAKKDFYATGGSRADGTIDMAYDFKMFEKPVVNQQQAQRLAKAKCARWGYGDAEPFGGAVTNCHAANAYGDCLRGQVIVKFQCLGNLDATSSREATPANSAPVGILSPAQYKEARLKALMAEKNLSYDEYTRRYQAIMAE